MKLIHDLRLAWRGLVKSPELATIVIGTLALGIGASTAIFSVVDGVLLEPLTFSEPERVVTVWGAGRNFPQIPISSGDFTDIREMSDAIGEFSARWSQRASLSGNDVEPEEVSVGWVTSNYFALLGVQPSLGRIFEADERDAVVLSHALWTRRFGADPDILERRVEIGGDPFTVVGVLPEGRDADLPKLRHVREDNQLWRALRTEWLSDPDRINGWLRVVGRLAPGADLRQAQRELDLVAEHIREVSPDHAHVDFELHVSPVLDDLVRSARPMLLTLLGAVAFVLLICCFNVANLLLVRGSSRARDYAVRSALGGGRFQLMRQLLVESALLSLLGAAAGVALAWGGVRLLKVLQPPNLPRPETVEVDTSVLGFALLCSFAAALIFGLVPAIRATRSAPAQWLAGRGREDASHHRLSRTLVVAEVALSLVLLIGTGLLLRSFTELRSIRPGFETSHILTASITESGRSENGEEVAAFFGQLEQRIAALPGVEAVGLANRMPLAGGVYAGPWATEQMKADGVKEHEGAFRFVTPGYFDAMGTRLLAGRLFRSDEDWNVAVVDTRFGAVAWPGEDPIGKRTWTGTLGRDGDWSEVIGVVEHQRHASLTDDYNETLFFPNMNLFPGVQRYLVVRASGDASALVPAVRSVLTELDAAATLARVRPIEDLVGAATSQHRFALVLIALFAAVAMFLALVGLYGVMSYSVSQRVREIGIRMAFGARRAEILGRVLRQGLSLVLAGVVLGLLGASGLTRFLSGLLVGVRPFEPSVIATVVLLLVGAGLVGAYAPARRAVAVDPAVALRDE